MNRMECKGKKSILQIFKEVNWRKVCIALVIFAFSSLLGWAPLALKYVKWFESLSNRPTSHQNVSWLLTSSDFYFSMLYIIVVSLADHLLSNDKKSLIYTAANSFFTLLMAMIYVIALFSPTFLLKVFIEYKNNVIVNVNHAIAFLIVLFVLSTLSSFFNIVYSNIESRIVVPPPLKINKVYIF